MLKIPCMLMLGSAGRNVGKTEFACSLFRKFCSQRDIIGIKVTSIDHNATGCHRGGQGCGACSLDDADYVITEETDSSSDKDTCRMLAAGAKKVFWIRALKTHLKQAITELIDTIGDDVASICESNSLRQVVEPGLFIMFKRTGQIEKSSAVAAVRYADRIVLFDGSKLALDADEIELAADKWAVKLQATAIIMAGGKSRRMGTDKSMLLFEGKPIIEHIYNQLMGHFTQILISSSEKGKYDFLDAKVVPDRLPGRGSLMGIASAVRVSDNDLNFVLACDIPRIDFALVKTMLRQCREFDAVIPKTPDAWFEPLFAVYSKNVLTAVDDFLATGKNKIIDALVTCKVNYIDFGQELQLRNLNTIDDYEEFCRMETIKGKIKAISVSKEKGTQKTNVLSAELKVDFGIVGDAHGGDWHRQVSLLAIESIDKMIARGAKVAPGNFAENITTEGLTLTTLEIGSKLKLGESAKIEITQFGKECHSRCAIYEQIGDCIMPREGVFAKVVSPGPIKIGDVIEVVDD